MRNRKRNAIITSVAIMILILSFVTFVHGTVNDAQDVKTVNVKTMHYSSTKAPEYTVFNIKAGATQDFTIKPASSGMMYLDLKGAEDESVQISLFMLKNGKYMEFDSSESIPVNKDIKYKFRVSVNSVKETMLTVSIRARVFTTYSKTVPQGTKKWTLASGVNKEGKNSTMYFKVKPDRTGLMKVDLKEYGYANATGYITLCNSKKKALSTKVSYNLPKGKMVYFGVKKNTTYYLKVTQCKGTKKHHYKYGVRYSMLSSTDRALGKKTSARKLIRKAEPVKSLFTASASKSADWYKFYVSKTRITQVQVTTTEIISGNVYVTVYGESGVFGTYTLKANDGGVIYQINNCTTPGKALPGWYYVKIEKSPKANGRYSISYMQ